MNPIKIFHMKILSCSYCIHPRRCTRKILNTCMFIRTCTERRKFYYLNSGWD